MPLVEEQQLQMKHKKLFVLFAWSTMCYFTKYLFETWFSLHNLFCATCNYFMQDSNDSNDSKISEWATVAEFDSISVRDTAQAKLVFQDESEMRC